MTQPRQTVRRTRTYGGESTKVVLRRARPIEEGEGRYPAFAPATVVQDGIRLDRDVPVVLRDGLRVFVDIYRPDTAGPFPAITAWSPFGKRCGEVGMSLPRGVPEGTLSPGTAFEGADPEYWCRYGYAVVNTDARGVSYSEGDIEYWSRAEGEDLRDVIDWIGEQPWCTGKVGLSGNSWLAITQWHAAAQRPRHLACIAPWEGVTDLYRDLAVRGGIPELGFTEFLIQRMFGQGYVDDITANAAERPFLDAYWREHQADLDRIDVPAYIGLGWSAFFHLIGTARAFRRLDPERTWLRTHRECEWPDYYTSSSIADLRLFFDRYLLGIRNGWEQTPRVRIEVMDRGDEDWVTDRPERDFPLPGTDYQRWYLDGNGLRRQPSNRESTVRYDAAVGSTVFSVTFAEDTEITGYLSARLWVEAVGSDDVDIFLTVQKVDADGAVVPTLSLRQPHPGAIGMLRASHRELDPDLTTEFEPVHAHLREQLLAPGEVVPIDVSIWPTSRIWHAGETLQLVVSGHHILNDPAPVDGRPWDWFEEFTYDTRNRGEHVVHTGGRYDSSLLLPVIPARRPIQYAEPFHHLTPNKGE